MTGPEHYQLAERLARSTGPADLQKAQIHATLALAAATALAAFPEGGLPQPDRKSWYDAASGGSAQARNPLIT